MIWGISVGELVIVDGTMKNADKIDIVDRNLVNSVERVCFGDAMITCIIQHDNAPENRAHNMQIWVDEHAVQVI